MVTMAMVMVMDMAMVMDTMDNLENKIFMLCRELSMDELEQLAKKLKLSIKGFQSLLIFEFVVPCLASVEKTTEGWLNWPVSVCHIMSTLLIY